jgi:hypothetical protein
MPKAMLFHNWSSEDFTHSWDSVSYSFKAGQQVYMEDWKCEHFAKHLALREAQKKGLEGNPSMLNEFMKRCIISDAPVVEEADASKLKTELLNETHKDTKDVARPKRDAS